MPSQSACTGTVKYGVSKSELLGVKRFSTEESATAGTYSDNTTNCAKQKIGGTPSANGSMEVNVQITTGPPLRVNDEVELELHFDDTGQNYISGTAIITRHGISASIEEGAEVPNYTYDFEWQGLPTYNGSLEPPA